MLSGFFIARKNEMVVKKYNGGGGGFVRRYDAAYATVATVVTMCLKERLEVVSEQSTIEIQFHGLDRCTVTVALVLRSGVPVISVCKEVQKEIVEEIRMLTPFVVEHVHLIVKKLVVEKTNA